MLGSFTKCFIASVLKNKESKGNLFLALLLLIGSPLLSMGLIWLDFIPFIGRAIRMVMILFCAVGSATGGFLLYGTVLARLKSDKDNQSEEALEKREETVRKDERFKVEAARKDHDLQLAREENFKLKLEKERLERMTIHVDSAVPILKLGLLKVNMTTYDFQSQIVDKEEFEEGMYPFKKKIKQQADYVGLQRVAMEANLGIDLKQVKVVEHDGILYVSGVRSESHGISHRQTEWLLKEIRKQRFVDDKEVEYKIDKNDTRITDRVLGQERSLESRLNQGLEFAEHDRTIHRIAEGYIRLLLSPTGKRIEFLSAENESGNLLPLEQFIDRYNTDISERKKQITNDITQNEQQIAQEERRACTD